MLEFDKKIVAFAGEMVIIYNYAVSSSAFNRAESEGSMKKLGIKFTRILLLGLSILVFANKAHAQCGGQMTLSATSLEWGGVQLGMPTQQSVEVFNPGPLDLCIENITTTNFAWFVSWDPVPIPAGGATTIFIDFTPNLARSYFGTIEIFSSDLDNPRDSIRVTAQACQPGLPPGEPVIDLVVSSSMFYYSLSDADAYSEQDYAIEVTDILHGNIYYGDQYGHLQFDPVFHRHGSRGQNFWIGAVGDLAPNTPYSVRLLARNCTGDVMEGPSVLVHTPPEIHEAAIESLTVHASATDAAVVELRWEAGVTDINNIPLPFDGYIIYSGNHPDSIDNLHAESYENYIELPAADSRKFFQVYGRTNGTYHGLAPRFLWPPENAQIYGMNTISICDPANWSEWQSIEVMVDSMGFWVTLLSLGPDELPEPHGIDLLVDFDALGLGFRMMMANVTDVNGVIHSVMRHVNVVSRPRADFTASYDPIVRTFTLFAQNINTPAPLFDIWWPISTVDERYGPAMQFESKLGEPDLHIVKPIPIMPSFILNEEQPWPLEDDFAYGVKVNDDVPDNFQVVDDETPATPCCIGIEINYFDSNLPQDSCFVTCEPSRTNNGSKTCRAGCRFNFKILWEWNPGTYNSSWEVHSKYTESHWDGTCEPGPGGDNVFTPAVGAAHTKTKDFKNQHGYAGATTGVLNSGDAKPLKSGVNADGKPFGSTPAWSSDKNGKQAEPVAQHKKDTALKNGKSMAVRIKGDYYFRVIAIDECPGADCDEEYNVHFDVVCCEDCDTLITTAPAVNSGP